MWKLFIVPTLAVATEQFGVKQHFDFEGMSTNFKAISAKQAQGVAIDQATFDAVRGFINQISVAVKDALEGDEEFAQEVYDKSIVDVESCSNSSQAALDGVVQDATDAANLAHSNWVTCKGEELTEFNNMSNHCDRVDDYVRDWNTSPNDHCATADFSGGDSDAVEAYMICICAFVEEHKDTYYDYRQKCIDATAVWVAKKQECCNPGLQSDMDDAFCLEQTEIQTMCHDYRVCWEREHGEHLTTKTTVEGWEDVMQAQRVALEQLICWGNHILDNNTDLNFCDDLAHTDCPYYTDCPAIVYGNALQQAPCTQPDASRLPCTLPYRAAMYGAYMDTDTPPSPCKDDCGTSYPFAEGGGGDDDR